MTVIVKVPSTKEKSAKGLTPLPLTPKSPPPTPKHCADKAIIRSKTAVRRPRKKVVKWEYDPLLPGLLTLPYEIILNHLLPQLDTESVFRIFTTCKTFFEMIGYPSEANHRHWNLVDEIIPTSIGHTEDLPLLHKLRLGSSKDWIHLFSYEFSTRRWKCQDCKKCRGAWVWEFRVDFCRDCIRNHAIGYLLSLI